MKFLMMGLTEIGIGKHTVNISGGGNMHSKEETIRKEVNKLLKADVYDKLKQAKTEGNGDLTYSFWFTLSRKAFDKIMKENSTPQKETKVKIRTLSQLYRFLAEELFACHAEGEYLSPSHFWDFYSTRILRTSLCTQLPVGTGDLVYDTLAMYFGIDWYWADEQMVWRLLFAAEMEKTDLDEGKVDCRWFALCPNKATGYSPHSVLGSVPTCDRCSDFAEGK